MIRPLRRAHRLIWTALALLLPALLALAIAKRHPPPAQEIPRELTRPAGAH